MTSTTSELRPRTILGPLTTTFTPAPTCSYVLVGADAHSLYTGWRGVQCVEINSPYNSFLDNTACWPGTTEGAPVPGPMFNGRGLYSPGLVCPVGYSTACSATAGGAADWAVQFAMESGETAVGCCPSGYACDRTASGPGAGQTCVQTFSSAMSVLTATCQWPASSMVPGLATYPLTWTQTETATNIDSAGTAGAATTISTTTGSWSVGEITARAPMIQINWQASDRAAAATATSSSSRASATASGSGSSGTVTVPMGVLAAVVVVVGILGILAAAFFFWRRTTRRNRHLNGEELLEDSDDGHQMVQFQVDDDTRRMAGQVAPTAPTELMASDEVPHFIREAP